ncbi:MAG TPA: hypothetical protein VGC06_20200 [Actinomycetes bacterium]
MGDVAEIYIYLQDGDFESAQNQAAGAAAGYITEGVCNAVTLPADATIVAAPEMIAMCYGLGSATSEMVFQWNEMSMGF